MQRVFDATKRTVPETKRVSGHHRVASFTRFRPVALPKWITSGCGIQISGLST